eukprot:12886504-Prorocentrum_lima.AAC.1
MSVLRSIVVAKLDMGTGRLLRDTSQPSMVEICRGKQHCQGPHEQRGTHPSPEAPNAPAC